MLLIIVLTNNLLHAATPSSLNFFKFQNRDSVFVPDTIIKKSGVIITGKIEGKNKFEVLIRIGNSADVEKVNNSVIREIHYANGTIENVEAKTGKISKEQNAGNEINWTKILVANEGSNLSGYIEKGEIEVEYVANKINMNDSGLEYNGLVLLKKRAAAMNGKVIKVTGKNIIREYGSFPYIIMKAMVYGIE
jgi:hypothetical protein